MQVTVDSAWNVLLNTSFFSSVGASPIETWWMKIGRTSTTCLSPTMPLVLAHFHPALADNS